MPSEPARNLVHAVLLAAWVAVGLLVTLSALAHPAALLGAGAFWLWFVGFAGSRSRSPSPRPRSASTAYPTAAG